MLIMVYARRKHNSVHQEDLWTAAECALGCCFSPFPLASHFGINLLKMKLCIKYVANPFEFQWEPGPPVWNSGPSWIVAITDSFQEGILWLWTVVTQTLWWHICTHMCKHTHQIWLTLCHLHTVERVDEFSLAHSTFHCRKNRTSLLIPIHVWWKTSPAKLWNSPVALCVDERRCTLC